MGQVNLEDEGSRAKQKQSKSGAEAKGPRNHWSDEELFVIFEWWKKEKIYKKYKMKPVDVSQELAAMLQQ